MRYPFIISLFFLLLAACAPAQPPAQGMRAEDPYLAQANAQATQAAAQAMLLATQQAQAERSLQATQAAYQTAQAAEQEIRLLHEQATATANAYALAATQGAATQMAPATLTPAAATQMAIQRQVQADEQRAAWDARLTPVRAFLPGIFWLAVTIFVVVGLWMVFRSVRDYFDARALEKRTVSGPGGEVYIITTIEEPDPNNPRRRTRRTQVLIPGRALGHALRNGASPILVDGLDDVGRQERMIAREQLARMVRGLTWEQAQQVPGMMPLTDAISSGEEPPAVVYLPPHNPEVRPILEEVRPRLMESEA